MKHNLHRISLRNGSEVLIIDVPNSPALHFSSIVRAGVRYGDKARVELPHLLEHLAFEGNADYPDGQDFAFAVEKLGAFCNATTSDTTIRYFIDASISSLDEVMALACSQLQEPTFEPAIIDQEKAVVTRELMRDRDDDGFVCWQNVSRQLYRGGYPTVSQGIKSLEHIDRADLLDYFGRTHTAGNTKFLIVGALGGKTTHIVKTLEKNLANYPTGDRLAWRSRALSTKTHLSTTARAKVGLQAHFRLVWHTDVVERTHLPAWRIFNTIFNVGLFSRWHRLARQQGLSYGPRSGYSMNRDNTTFSISDRTEPEHMYELFELGVTQLAKVLAGDFDQREFARAKGFVTGDFESSFQSTGSFASWYLADYSSDIELETPANYKALLLAVQPKDLAVLNDYFRGGRWVLSLVGDGMSADEARYRAVVEKHFD